MKIRQAKLSKKILNEIAIYREMDALGLSKIKVLWAISKKICGME